MVALSSITTLGLYATAQIRTIAGTTHTLVDDDHGYILNCTSASAVTITVPTGLRTGFLVGISQGGAGKVTLAVSGTTITERDGKLATAAQYVLLSLVQFSANTYRLFGPTAA